MLDRTNPSTFRLAGRHRNQRSAGRRLALAGARGLMSVLAAALVGAVGGVGGCVSEGPPQRTAPASSIPAQPAGLTVNRVVFTVPQVLEDRDRNGYYDTIPATVYLFDTRYAYSIRQPGVFSFSLIEPTTGTIVASWDIPWETAKAAEAVTWTGTLYTFQLDLREARRPVAPPPATAGERTPPGPSMAGDRLPATEVLIGCRFTPESEEAGGGGGAGGGGVECGSRLTVLIGKTR